MMTRRDEWWLIVLLSLALLADVFTTVYGLSQDAREMNPLLAQNMPLGIAARGLAVVVIAWCLWQQRSQLLRRAVVGVAFLGIVWWFGAAANNLQVVAT